MLIKTLTVGPIETNCYVVTNEATLECVVVDPGDESNTILDYIEDRGLKLKAILLTHGHYDHVNACEAVSSQTGAKVYMNEKDDFNSIGSPILPYSLGDNGQYVSDGDVIREAGMEFTVIATPGHTPGGVTYKTDGALFTGDTLFRGSCGRTDLPGGDMNDLMASLAKLCAIEGDYEVYPGHMDSSSLVREKSFNFYCRQAMQR